MSANLLADLDSFYQTQESITQPSTSSANPSAPGDSSINAAPNVKSAFEGWPAPTSSQDDKAPDDDDDFGEFESGEQEPPNLSNKTVHLDWSSSVAQQTNNHLASRGPHDSYVSSNGLTGVLKQSLDTHAWDMTPPEPAKTEPRRKKPRDEDVLFDASDEEQSGDDFGGFAEVDAPAASQPRSTLDVKLMPIERRPDDWNPPTKRATEVSLLDFDEDDSANVVSPVMSMDAAHNQWQSSWNTLEPSSHSAVNLDKQSQDLRVDKQNHQKAVNFIEQSDNGWEDFEPTEMPQVSVLPERAKERPSNPSDISLTPVFPTHAASDLPTSQQAPTNIPPPAVLLSLVSSILSAAKSTLFDPLAALTSSSEQATRAALLSHPSTEEFLKGYLAVITVTGRIIAGRKLRWKRDTLLSQSMRIGPSFGGKSSGMKLAGIDRGESAREEREVADIVRSYRAQVGRVRTAVTGAGLVNETGSSKVNVPDLAEALPVRTAVASEGAVTANKACALCGIKRNERVSKVDVDVSDAFGEWWIEYWGHRTCRNFWEAKKDDLAHR